MDQLGCQEEWSRCFRTAIKTPNGREAYSTLEFAKTYHLAFRDLPAIVSRYLKGGSALDFGCGTGRSARFVSGLGFKKDIIIFQVFS